MLHRILDISLQYYQRFPSLLVGGQTDYHHSLYEHNARAIGIGGGTCISVSAVGSRSHGPAHRRPRLAVIFPFSDRPRLLHGRLDVTYPFYVHQVTLSPEGQRLQPCHRQNRNNYDQKAARGRHEASRFKR